MGEMITTVAELIAAGFFGTTGTVIHTHLVKMFQDHDPFGNVRRIVGKAHANVKEGRVSRPLSTGSFERLLQARNVDDDAVQDMWADVVAQALGGDLADADTSWALEQLGQMRGQDPLLFALTARAMSRDEYLVLEAPSQASFQALLRAGNRCSRWVSTNHNTPPNLNTSFVPTPRGEPVPVGISNVVTRESRGRLQVVLADPTIARRWIGFGLQENGPGLAEIVRPQPLMSYGRFDDMLLSRNDGIACVAQAYVEHHIKRMPNR
jgi:hypothetical protein